MNHFDSLERDLTTWFADTTAPRTPDYVDDLVQGALRASQRPAWTIPERWIPVSAITLGRGATRPFPWRTVVVLAALALIVATTLAVYIGSQPRVPAPFGLASNGRIAFGRDGDIVTVDPTDGSEAVLVGGDAQDDWPNYSRDGTMIEFERDISGQTQLNVVAADGGEPRVLTPTLFDGAWGISWSPDSSELLFVDGGLVIVPIDGSGENRLSLAVEVVGYPAWRPTGGEIVFSGNRNGVIQWYIVRRDGSDLRPITLGDGSPMDDALVQWSPDGGRLISTRGEGGPLANERYRLHVMTLGDSGVVTNDTTVGPPVLAGPNRPVGYIMSPDGTRLAAPLVQGADQTRWRMGVISAEDGGSIIETGPVFVKNRHAYGWSPDGSLIVVKNIESHETWLLDAAGGEARQGSWADFTDDLPVWQRRR
jgi:TolB protein